MFAISVVNNLQTKMKPCCEICKRWEPALHECSCECHWKSSHQDTKDCPRCGNALIKANKPIVEEKVLFCDDCLYECPQDTKQGWEGEFDNLVNPILDVIGRKDWYLISKIKSFIKEKLITANNEGRDVIEKYNELIMAVGNKYDGETRHETALRYIRQAEKGNNTAKALSPNKDKDK